MTPPVLYDHSATPRANYERLAPVIWLPEYAEPLAKFEQEATRCLCGTTDQNEITPWRNPLHVVLFALAARPTRTLQERFNREVLAAPPIPNRTSVVAVDPSSVYEGVPDDLYKEAATTLQACGFELTGDLLKELRRQKSSHAASWDRIRKLAYSTRNRSTQPSNDVSLGGGFTNAIERTVGYLFTIHTLALLGQLPRDFIYLKECARQNVGFLESLASLSMDDFFAVIQRIKRPDGFGFNLEHVKVIETDEGHRLRIEPSLQNIARGIGSATGIVLNDPPKLRCPGLLSNVGEEFDPNHTAVTGLLDTVLYAFDEAGIWRNDPRLQSLQPKEQSGPPTIGKSIERAAGRMP